jgi:hypothetical protein
MSFRPDLILNTKGPIRLEIGNDIPEDALREKIEALLLSDSPLTELEELEEEQKRRSIAEKKAAAKERRIACLKAQDEKYQQEDPSLLFPELLHLLEDDKKELWQPPKYPLPVRKDREPSVLCTSLNLPRFLY